MKFSKISMKLIKPHTPTPQNLKNYHISLLDKFTGPMNFAVVLFYQSKPKNNIQLLEKSLSKTLVKFYPLAGRYMKKDHLVVCSDEGVEFVEAEAVDVELVDLVAKIDTDELDDLLPYQHFRTDEAPTDPVLAIQATHFRSGGLAIAVSVSHRLFDGSSLRTFVTAWSNAANPCSFEESMNITPCFDLPSLLPNKEHNFGEDFKELFSSEDRKIVKMFSFNAARLKSNIKPATATATSRVSAVSAVIAKALIRLDRAKHGRCRDFVITQPVNMRGRANPPPPPHACGNFSFGSITPRRRGDSIGIEELCELVGEAARKSIGEHAQILSPNIEGRDSIIVKGLESIVKEVMTPETNAIHFTDGTRFGFYEADFGWGSPVWTAIGPLQPLVTTVVLLSSKGGDAIEAWVHLTRNDMRCFEQDEDIKFFATNCRNQQLSKL